MKITVNDNGYAGTGGALALFCDGMGPESPDVAIASREIKPRENVFTYNAWQALKRQVRKGESGVKIITWIPCKDKDSENSRMLCKRSTVFHVSQTDPTQ